MYHKLLRLITLCFIIQLCLVTGFPTPAEPAKDAADKTDKAAKDATATVEKAAEGATDASKKALEEVDKKVDEVEKEIGKATTAATDTAASAPEITKGELDTFMALLGKAATTSGSNNAPLQNLLTAFRNAPNPIGMLQNLIASLGPLSDIFQSVIDGLTNIYLENRGKALEFTKMITQPLLDMSRVALSTVGAQDTADKLRSTGFKFVVDNMDNAVQGVNAIASTAPTVMRQIERTGSGLIKMPSLNF